MFNRISSIILKDSLRLKISTFLSLVLILIVYPGAQSLLAVENQKPFSTIAIRISGAHNSNRNTFHEFWEPELGAELLLETPFYLGDIQAGIHLYSYSGRDSYQPDFKSVYIFIGWGLGFRLFQGIQWYNGLQLGSYQMYFDDSDIDESQVLESELGVGLNTRFDFNLTNSWSLRLGAAYLHVYTKKPLELIMITAGVSYTFDTPEWLKEILK